MKYLIVIVLIAISKVAFSQSEINPDKEFLLEANLPDEISTFYLNTIKNNYSLRSDLNPFYLRGDFDGDKILDYAFGVIEKSSKKKGFIIYHIGKKTHLIVGAGKSLMNGNGGDDYSWMDAWKVFSGKTVEGGVGETEKVNLVGEAIVVIKTESASAMIYWTGKEYKWYQLGD